MKFVIDFQGIKREITGPFRICASSLDLQILKESLYLPPGASYGWIKVTEDPMESASNTKPLSWLET